MSLCYFQMAQLITVRLNKSDQQPLGFRLQGGKDFGTPLVVQKVIYFEFLEPLRHLCAYYSEPISQEE